MTRLEEALVKAAEASARRPGGDGRPKRRRIAVAMPGSPGIVRCVSDAARGGIADFVLVGDRAAFVRALASDGIAPLPDHAVEFVPADDPVAACTTACDMAASGEADILMKGLVQTADFMRAILDRSRDLVAEGSLLSHVAVLDVPACDRLLFLSDAAVNILPNLEQKERILLNAAAVARRLSGRVINVACLGPVEKVSSRIQSTVDAAALAEKFAGQEEMNVQGPLAFDAAVSIEAAEVKGISGPVAGRADLIIAPNIDAGNVCYKALTCMAHATVAGIVAGARIPVVLTSRADSEKSKYNSLRFALATC